MIRVNGGPGEEVSDLFTHIVDDHRAGTRRLMLNMVASIDGAATLAGGATRLADDDDRQMFAVLRAVSDVILVGADTVRVENYGPVRLSSELTERRSRLGLAPSPRLAIVSGSLALDPGHRVFSDPDRPPYVITTREAPTKARRALDGVAKVMVAGDHSAQPATILDLLADEGHTIVLGEGGPTLNGDLLAAGVVDEVNLTLSPMMVGGEAARIVDHAPELGQQYRLARLLLGDRMLFTRYLRV